MTTLINYSVCLLLFSSLLLTTANATCLAKTNLDQFHKENVLIDNKYRYKMGETTKYGYIYNYPVNILRNSKASDINTIFSLNSFDWQCQLELNFLFRRFQSPTAMLIALDTSKMEWKKLPLTIFINNRQLRQDLYFGEGAFDIPSSSNQFQTDVPVPFQNPQTKYMTFITGIVAKFKDTTNYMFTVSLKQQNSGPSTIKITVRYGSTITLSKISLFYVAYNPKASNFHAYSNEITFVNKQAGSSSGLLNQEIASTDNLILGIRGLKQLMGPSEMMNFKIISQFTLTLQLGQYTEQVTVGYLGIHAKPSTFCSNCPGSKILSSASQTTCESNCDNSMQASLQGGASICLSCPAQLNILFKNGKCECKSPQFIAINPLQSRSKCVTMPEFMEIMSLSRTQSVSNQQCSDPNAQATSNGCVCKVGYEKDPVSAYCIKKCPLGLWRGTFCQKCPAGTYPWDSQSICKQCTQNCAECATQYTCKSCQPGFYRDNMHKCVDICGDGKRFNSTGCDDGNKVDKDGCNSNCEPQMGYTCSGGSPNKRDTCTLTAVTLSLASNQITTNMLIMTFTVSPPPKQAFETQQVYQIFEVSSTLHSLGYYYALYISQDPTNFGSFQFVFDFRGTLPIIQSADVTVKYLISNPVATSTNKVSFLAISTSPMNARSINGDFLT